jgi:peptide/nickel transport system permease protein
MGSYLLSSIQQRDYPVVQAIVLMTAVVVVVTNLVVDLAYAILDPRIELA